MTKARMKLHGLDELKKRLGRIPEHVRAQVDPVLAEGAELVARDAINSIETGSRTGRMYGDHQASAPGEPPANLTGELAESIHSVRRGSMSYTVEADAKHGLPLELGTSNMEARPFMGPALQRNKLRIKNMINSAVKTAVKMVKKKK